MPKYGVTHFVSKLSIMHNMCMSILKFSHDVTIQLQDYSSYYQKLLMYSVFWGGKKNLHHQLLTA
jgi:hypothetical protein